MRCKKVGKQKLNNFHTFHSNLNPTAKRKGSPRLESRNSNFQTVFSVVDLFSILGRVSKLLGFLITTLVKILSYFVLNTITIQILTFLTFVSSCVIFRVQFWVECVSNEKVTLNLNKISIQCCYCTQKNVFHKVKQPHINKPNRQPKLYHINDCPQ